MAINFVEINEGRRVISNRFFGENSAGVLEFDGARWEGNHNLPELMLAPVENVATLPGGIEHRSRNDDVMALFEAGTERYIGLRSKKAPFTQPAQVLEQAMDTITELGMPLQLGVAFNGGEMMWKANILTDAVKKVIAGFSEEYFERHIHTLTGSLSWRHLLAPTRKFGVDYLACLNQARAWSEVIGEAKRKMTQGFDILNWWRCSPEEMVINFRTIYDRWVQLSEIPYSEEQFKAHLEVLGYGPRSIDRMLGIYRMYTNSHWGQQHNAYTAFNVLTHLATHGSGRRVNADNILVDSDRRENKAGQDIRIWQNYVVEEGVLA